MFTLADSDTPVLWTDLEKLEKNITWLGRYFRDAGVHWRPHMKGIKVPRIAHMAIASGAIGVTCAKLSEAEVMAAAGIRDILVANQVVGQKKIDRLVNLRFHSDVKVAVDNLMNIRELGHAASRKGVEIGILVEVDIGMARAGVLPGIQARDLGCRIQETPGLRFLGLFGWEGQTRTLQDLEARRSEIMKSIRLLKETADLCRDAELPVEIVSAGGTGTFYVTAFEEGITEIQAGGAIFGDVASQTWGVETEPSLYVRTMVSSRPALDRVVIDAGFKAMPGWKNQPQVVDLPGVKSINFFAEHGVLLLDEPNTKIEVGDMLDFVVGYGDITVFLYDELYGIRRGEVEIVWPIWG